MNVLSWHVVVLVVVFHLNHQGCVAFQRTPGSRLPSLGFVTRRTFHDSYSCVVSLNALKNKKKDEFRDKTAKQGRGLFFVAETPSPVPSKGSPAAKQGNKKITPNSNDNDEETNDNDTGVKAATAAAAGTTLAAARTATTLTGGIAATTASVTSGSTTASVGTSVVGTTLGAARGATTLASTVAATTASVTTGTVTVTTTTAAAGTVASSGLVGARIGTTIASGVGASGMSVVSGTASTLGTTATTTATTTAAATTGASSSATAGSALAGARAATSMVGASAIVSGTATSTTTTTTATTAAATGSSLLGSRVTTTVGSGLGATVVGKATSGVTAVSGKVGATRAIPFFATATSTTAIKGGTASRLVGAGAAVLASTDLDALSGGAAAIMAVDSATTATTTVAASAGFGEALAGAATEMLGDATTLVGDAIMDGVSAVGSAVADVAIGVATDTAIGSGTAWGIWDGLHRVLPGWVFSGGAAVLGSEIAFAAFAFFVASGAWDESKSGTLSIETRPTGIETIPPTAVPFDSVLVGGPVQVPRKEIDTTSVLADVELALQAAADALEAIVAEPVGGTPSLSETTGTDLGPSVPAAVTTMETAEGTDVVGDVVVPLNIMGTSDLLLDLQTALEEVANGDLTDIPQPPPAFVIGDVVKIVGGTKFKGRTAVVLSERGVNSGYWNLRVDGENGPITTHRKVSNLQLLPATEFDRKEFAQRKLLEARIRLRRPTVEFDTKELAQRKLLEARINDQLPKVEFDKRELAQRQLLAARIRYEIRYMPRST